MRSLTKTGNYISNRIGKAIADYNLIEDKDKILVAVSGGKDSLSLLKLLAERKKWAPVNYELIAMHVESDYECGDREYPRWLKKFFKENGVKHHFEKIRLLKGKTKKRSCFWCSWNRRKALFLAAERLGCNKVALGHHMDDIIETLLLNLFYHGEFSAMKARQELFEGKIVIIRPLCYVEESYLRRFSKESGFVAQPQRCGNADMSKRRMMKDFIKKVEGDCSYVKKNVFRSMARVKEEYLNAKGGE